MDSEHRHELKQNELADWIYHAPEFLKQYAQYVAAAVLIIAALVVLSITWSRKKTADLSQQALVTSKIGQINQEKIKAIRNNISFAASDPMTSLATDLRTQSDQVKTNALAALSLIKSGDAIRAKLHYLAEELTVEKIETNVEKARKAYEDALAKAVGAPNQAELTAMANFGLGLCAEELADYTKAAEIYQKIMGAPSLEGTIFPKKAALRMETMIDSKGSYSFVDAPPPPPPSTRPSSSTSPRSSTGPRTLPPMPSTFNPLQEPIIPGLKMPPKPAPKTEESTQPGSETGTGEKTDAKTESGEQPKTETAPKPVEKPAAGTETNTETEKPRTNENESTDPPANTGGGDGM